MMMYETRSSSSDMKQISGLQLSKALESICTDTISVLDSLKAEIKEKKELALEKSSFIREKVDALLKDKEIQVDEEEYKKSEESVQQYAQLLDNIIEEIDNEKESFTSFLQGICDDDSIKERVKYLKKYAKSIQKDLNVSFSRYCFGFDAQMNKIISIEMYLATKKEKPE